MKEKLCRIMPPTYLFLLLVSQIGLNYLVPRFKILDYPLSYMGFLLITVGGLLNLWTDKIFKEEETTVKPNKDPSQLLTEGPFRISRHPMYLGMFFILLGAAFVLGTFQSFIFPLLFLVLMEVLFIPTEEKNLERLFGEEYIRYKNMVRRWM